MEIKSIYIKNISGGHLKGDLENVRHVKALPYISVVQSVHGHYEVGLDGALPQNTAEGGAFVAPIGAMQDITHHNGINGYMEAQWVFMKISVNDFFDFQDLFELPFVISEKYSARLKELIFTIRSDPSICRKYAAAYELTDILIENSLPKNTATDARVVLLKKYIDEHYSERLTKEALAKEAFCSVPNLYRIFQKNFNLSPHNYINKVRLEKACMLLENSNYSITEIAEAVGFEDQIYFSKQFKKYYGLSPKKYRASSPFAELNKSTV